MDIGVSFLAQANEVVILTDDLAGRAGEVDGKVGDFPAQIVHVEDQAFRQFGSISPHYPAAAEGGQAVLVSGRADGFHAGDAEVKGNVRSAEGSQERTAGAVHMDVNVNAGLGFIVIQGLGNVRREFISARVGHAKGGHHHDGVFIHLFQQSIRSTSIFHFPGAMGISRISMSQ